MVISNESYLSVVADFFNAQLALSKTLADASLECSEELISINVTAAKTRIAETTVFTQRFMNAKDPYERLMLMSSRLQARVGGAFSVAQRIANVTVNAQSQVSDAVKQQMEELKRKTTVANKTESAASSAILTAAGGPPPATEPVSTGIEHLNQATDVIQSRKENQEKQQAGALDGAEIKTAGEVISTKQASEQRKFPVAQVVK